MSIHYPLAGATDAGAWDGLLGWGLGMRKAINIAWLAAAFASSNAALADFIYPIPDVGASFSGTFSINPLTPLNTNFGPYDWGGSPTLPPAHRREHRAR
jgi:hypothetical protein